MTILIVMALLAGCIGGALLMSNQGEGILAENMVNKTAPQTLKLKLYKNDYTPVDGSTEANFTEANFTGYGDISCTPANWTATPGPPTLLQFPQQTFTSSADQTTQSVYGYYLVQTTSGKYMWGERFTDGPYPITNNGDVIKVTAKLQVKKQGE